VLGNQGKTIMDDSPKSDVALPDNLMQELAKIVGEAQRVPKVGTDAAAGMRACFEQVASDIERVSLEHKARADEIHQEALSFASVVRKAGDVLCAQIEREAIRGYKVSKALHFTRQMVQETELYDHTPDTAVLPQ